MLTTGLIILLLLMATGVPLFIAFAAGGSMILLYSIGFSSASIGQLLYASIDKYIFLAIPLFVLTGTLMAEGGASPPLIRMVNSFLGRIPGGLGLSVVGASGLFAALSGSNAATAAAIGSIMIPEMEKSRYSREYATALAASSGCLGNLIPPSLTAIIYCGVVEISVAKQFLGGVFPGILLMIFLGGVSMFISRKRGYGEGIAYSWKERLRATRSAIPALLMPVIILGGIYGGVFTVTEAAAVACAYVTIVGFLIYRRLTPAGVWRAIISGSRITANICFLIATIGLLAKVLIITQLPQAVASWAVYMNFGPLLFLIMATLVMFLLGCFLEAIPLVLVSIPVFMPTMVSLGIDPILFGTLLALEVGVGQITPPVGVVLYVTCGISKAPLHLVVKEVIPFLMCQVVVTLMVVVFPSLATFLPSLL